MDALVHGEPLISGQGISLQLGNRVILDSVDIDVMPGEIVTLIGPNGAGKSSLVRVLLGLQSLTGGRVARKSGLRVGYVPQRFPLTPNVPLDVKRLLSLTLQTCTCGYRCGTCRDRHRASEGCRRRLALGRRAAARASGAGAAAQARASGAGRAGAGGRLHRRDEAL